MTGHGMTLAAAEAELARYTYKPGWTFKLCPGLAHYPDNSVTVTLRITFEPAADSRGTMILTPGDTFTIISLAVLPEYLDAKCFGDWLEHQIIAVEIHEQQEWFKRDGVIITDPHTTGRRS